MRAIVACLPMISCRRPHYTPTMLQPAGGMDAIPRAFARALGEVIRYEAEVVEIRRAEKRARVVWRDRDGTSHALEADHVVCTIPLPVLRAIPADFSAAVREAIARGAENYVPAVKVAFAAQERWWEAREQIYGGISWTAQDITQLWYPSHGFHDAGGILLGAYIWTDETGGKWAALTPQARLAAAIKGGERLHPGYAGSVGAASRWRGRRCRSCSAPGRRGRARAGAMLIRCCSRARDRFSSPAST
jgi:monoamine oxidase